VDRETALMKLAVGNIFHGEAQNGASLICLVTAVSETAIYARTVTTQLCLEFDRQSGLYGRAGAPGRSGPEQPTGGFSLVKYDKVSILVEREIGMISRMFMRLKIEN